MLQSKINSVADLSAKKRALVAFIFGAISVMGLAPFFLWPLYIIAFSAFSLLLYYSQNKKQAFWAGWSFGFGYFVFGLYWISLALHVDWAMWWWLTPFAAIALPAVLALYYGLASILTTYTKTNKLGFALGTAVIFSLFEYIRGWAFTGFPWNLPSYIWVDSPVGQNLSWLGAYGLNIFAFLTASLLGMALVDKRYAYAPLVMLLLLYGFGAARTHNINQTFDGDKTILIVQPNIAQIEKWDKSKELQHFEKLLDLTRNGNTDYILWPETALTVKKSAVPALRTYLKDVVATDQILFTGVTDARSTNEEFEFFFYNSMIGINAESDIEWQYNKHHLVPFGEYVPFRKYLKFGGLAQTLSATGDFKAGPGPQSLKVDDDFSISPLICYEIIFPGRVTAQGDRPDLLVNITNDGWYLKSLGPYQHLAMARARAIETGIPVARAANTGVSALIDPYGQIVLQLALQTDGTINSSVPHKIKAPIYFRYKEKIFWALVFALMFIMLIFKGGAGLKKG